MKTVSIINLKGGVAKTLTTVSMAYALSQQYNARVLVVDNDKQGNCSKTFGVHSYDRMSIADLMLDRDADWERLFSTPSTTALMLFRRI